MVRAAAAWSALGAQLEGMAAAYRAVIAGLDMGQQGASAFAVNSSVTSQLAWLDATAAQARQLAAKATAAAGAYGLTRAAVAPPHVVDANRLRRISLAATNCLGQSSPAIADLDAAYDRMWAQGAAAMHAYARASADASKATPFSSPPLTHCGRSSNAWTLAAAPEVISTGCQVISTIPEALDALASAPLTNLYESVSPITAPLSKLSSLSAPTDFALNHLNLLNKAAALFRAAALRSLEPRAGRANRAAPHASFGRGAAIGALSVPRSWPQSKPCSTWQGPTAGPVGRSQ